MTSTNSTDGHEMTERIPQDLIEYILLGSGDSRRHMQDSPILGDVWIAYAGNPQLPVDLLITSHKDATANDLAAEIFDQLGGIRQFGIDNDPRIAPLQNYVVARLYFNEVLRVLIPMTKWWLDPRTRTERDEYLNPQAAKRKSGISKIEQTVADVRALLEAWTTDSITRTIRNRRTAFERFVALCALVFMAGSPPVQPQRTATTQATWTRVQTRTKATMADTSDAEIKDLVLGLLGAMEPATEPRVWQIARNRPASAAIKKSVPAVKADAARRLFDIDCSNIVWAIVDSGIDTDHVAFEQRKIAKTYDFTFYRDVTDLGNVDDDLRKDNLAAIKLARGNTLPPHADSKLRKIAQAAVDRQPMRTDLIREFLDLGDEPPDPTSEHGTHVAGIIAAVDDSVPVKVTGMCPGIGLYDLRILGSDREDTEFAVIAALQFIRRANESAGDMKINGVNMSLSIEHDVRNYACGATPVCLEAERLVDSGVVVVAAAGNFGYQNILVNDQPFNNYLAFSITDPGNADRVITVGSTHHYAPFTYGISYFSSRGPTGDGRLKPDLVAPGERIYAPVLDDDWDYLDGTSMAAPHVSGAAALLMARYPELIGKPDKIKKILCETASDLGRERNFQGHGLLDVLRALQSQ
ncbi:S8 family peptidase [Mycobacterium deserti]|uniref:S8 family peptidase n=1 Tax=Mycobacterium deserti TaxID=2978347 RepID=A0ABT2MAW0_9MYCO|nr:S8 family peptidase [Mycobacterium deserti]MCT7658305.1 S8 family peptidase [Mycobacterium deserti]